MSNLIAARMGCYGAYSSDGWSHLPTLGVHHVEIGNPAPDQVEATKKKLADHGLTASSLETGCDIHRPDAADDMKPKLDACAELGAKVCFVSVHAGGLPRETAWERLRAVGDEAAARGVTIAMETHPDLCHNGDAALATMQAVDHPNVRINFDTANVCYYNDGCTTIGELAKIAGHVASVHLKDSTGEYHNDIFPTLGTGVVDFPGVFQLLGERGFKGPYTLELEGPEERTREEQFRHVAESIEHLRSIGAFD